MRRFGGFVIFMYLAIATSGCGKADPNQAQNQPPATQQPAAQAQAPQQSAAPQTAAQAQPPEATPQPPSRMTSQKAAQPRPASPAPAPAPAAQPPAQAPPVQPPAVPATEAKPAVSDVPVTPPKAPAVPAPIVVASGSRLEIRLVDPISSETNKMGETFRATLDRDLEVNGTVVAPRGSLVKGKVLDVKASGRVEGRAAMSVTLTGIEVGKTTYPIQTNTLAFQAEKSTKDDALKIGIGAAIGAAIGAIAGGGKGAAIGAAVGGGAGTATVLVTKGKEVTFPAEERFSFVLQSSLEIRR